VKKRPKRKRETWVPVYCSKCGKALGGMFVRAGIAVTFAYCGCNGRTVNTQVVRGLAETKEIAWMCQPFTHAPPDKERERGMTALAPTPRRRRKRCPLPGGCGRRRVDSKFSVDNTKSDGRCSYCSDCTRRKAQAYRDRQREESKQLLADAIARTQRTRELLARNDYYIRGRRRLSAAGGYAY